MKTSQQKLGFYIIVTSVCVYITVLLHQNMRQRRQAIRTKRGHHVLKYIPLLIGKNTSSQSEDFNNKKFISMNVKLESKIPGYRYPIQLPREHPAFKSFKSSATLYIGSSKTGRIGNQLFQFASAYGVSRLLNRTLVIGNKDKVLKMFSINDTVTTDRKKHIQKWHLVLEKKCCTFDRTLIGRVKKEINHRVGYYLQSWRYFEHVQDELRDLLQFLQPIQRKVNKIMRRITRKYDCTSCFDGDDNLVYIGIHIRRGDMFKLNQFRDYGYRTAPAHYLYRAMYYFMKKFKRPIFVVCSDDMKWTHQILGDIRNVNIEFVHQKSEVDLAVLAACNHTIMTVGTFGWWAGYLAGGDVIYYKYPVRRGSPLQRGYNSEMDDYFLPHWMPLA